MKGLGRLIVLEAKGACAEVVFEMESLFCPKVAAERMGFVYEIVQLTFGTIETS